MKRSRKSTRRSYRQMLLAAMSRFLPTRVFRPFGFRPDARWTPRFLVYAVILMAWGSAKTLADRYDEARQTVVRIFPSRRRPGRSYQGFIGALLRWSVRLLVGVTAHLREAICQIAEDHWRREGFIAFAPDGTRVECPRTEGNEKALGCGGRKGSGPQFWLTTLWRMGTGLPWAWRIGPAKDAERTHVREMLWLLPRFALLVADAGFTGYELFWDVLASGRSLLIRLGSNVRLLRELGYAEVEKDGTVYLWPQRFQKKYRPPLLLRLIVLERKGKKIYLVTNLSDSELPIERAARLHEMRWGVEMSQSYYVLCNGFYHVVSLGLGLVKMAA